MNDRRFQLTDFDREVLSVLLSHGGWTASARAKLAVLAKRYGVSAAGLSRVVAGLAQAARSGQLQSVIASSQLRRASAGGGAAAPGARGAQGAGAAGAPGAVGTMGAAGVAPAAGRAAGPHPAAGPRLSRSDHVLIAVVAASFLVSIVLIVKLALMVVDGLGSRSAPPAIEASAESPSGGAAAVAGTGGGTATDGTAPPYGSAAPDATTVPGTPTGGGTAVRDRSAAPPAESRPRASTAARPPAVPAIYPRVPAFHATLDAPAFMQAQAEAPSIRPRLDDFARDPRSLVAAKRDWAEAQRAVALSWPRLDPTLRRSLLERTVAVARAVDEPAAAESLLEPFRAAVAAEPAGPAEIRAGAWGAGVIGTLLTEPGLSEAMVNAIAGMRLAPADGSGDAFERFAASWLDRAVGPIMDRIGSATAHEDFDRLEAWIEAQRRVRPPAEANDAWLRAVDAMVRRPLRTDLPGASSDMLGRLLAEIEWSDGAPVTSPALRRRFEQWLADPAVESTRLWALGSIVRQGALAPWFGAEMVVGPQASMGDRREISRRLLEALSAGAAEPPPISSVPRELLRRRDALLERLTEGGMRGPIVVGAKDSPGALALSGASAPARRAVRDALEAERLAALGVIGALLLDGRTNEAAERLAALERSLEAPALDGLGPAGRSLPVPPVPSSDGMLGKRLDQARSSEERIDAIRRRRAEASTDLGPLDASRLAREALLGETPSVRLTAQGVIVDSFASGPRVAQELVDHFWLVGSWDSTLGRFIERLTGERLPPHTNPRFRTEALAALLRHRLRLSEHPWHGVEALLARTAALSAERVDVEGGAAEGLRDVRDPGPAIDTLAEVLRARAGSRAVLRPVPAPLEVLDRRDEARRALAAGPAQRWVAALWRVLELEAFVAAADRPALAGAVGAIVEECVTAATRAPTALAQAVEIERARARLQGLLVGPGSGGAT